MSDGISEDSPGVATWDAGVAAIWSEPITHTVKILEKATGQTTTLATQHETAETWVDRQPFAPHVMSIGSTASLHGRTLRLRSACRALLGCRARLVVNRGRRTLLRTTVIQRSAGRS